jgi:mycofactocin system glycosyltransferase
MHNVPIASVDQRVSTRTTGYEFRPPLAMLADPRGAVIARLGTRRGVVVNAAAVRVFYRLAPDGVLSGSVSAPAARAELRLLELLASRGLAQRQRSLVEPLPTVQIVVPTYGRLRRTALCLDAIRQLDYPAELVDLVVVNDGHPDAAATAAEAERVGARLVRRSTNGGPAAARNAGARIGETSIVAFVDSDCLLPPDWLSALLPELAEPDVWAVAGRVIGLADGSTLGDYEVTRSPLDMGDLAHDLDVADGRLFVPSANLLVSRAALGRLNGFDERLRVGEDVDLCLRILRANGRVRFVPSVIVTHAPRTSLAAFARQRIGYAASEALLIGRYPPLARAVPIPLVPMSAVMLLTLSPRIVPPWVRVASAATILFVQARAWTEWGRRTWAGSGETAPTSLSTIRSTARANGTLVTSLVRQAARHYVVPVALVAGRFRRWRFAGLTGLLLGGAALSDYWRLRPSMDPMRFLLIHVLDDLAYNAGLLIGAVRARSPRAYFGRLVVSTGLPRRLDESTAKTSSQPFAPGR